MTRAALIIEAHALDAVTLLAVLPLASMSGEYGIGAGLVYPLAGLAGVIAMKAAGIGLMLLVVTAPFGKKGADLRLSLAVAAGLLGAAVNSAAYVVLRGGL